MGAYSRAVAYLSKPLLRVGAYSGGGLIREWGLKRSFMVLLKYLYTADSTKLILILKINLREWFSYSSCAKINPREN